LRSREMAESYLRDAEIILEEAEEQLPLLNKYYTVTRYPDAANSLPSESVDRVEAERAVRLAREVVDHAWRSASEG